LNGKAFTRIDNPLQMIIDAKDFRNSEELVMVVDEDNKIVGSATRKEMRE
jgi:hypothetical protein